MNIGGFQKFSLLDYPGQLAAIVFTQGCNFRCPYCHNPELVDPQRFTELIEEQFVLEFLSSRVGKLGAVVITGGEPTLHDDLPLFIRQIKELGFLVKLDTNGSRAAMLELLAKDDLVDYWAMDIKAPWHLYPLVSKSDVKPSTFEISMDIIRQSGKKYEFRTTFFDSLLTWEDIQAIQATLMAGDHYYLQQCRYESTLEELSSCSSAHRGKYFHLNEDPKLQYLLQQAGQNDVSIELRTL